MCDNANIILSIYPSKAIEMMPTDSIGLPLLHYRTLDLALQLIYQFPIIYVNLFSRIVLLVLLHFLIGFMHLLV